MINNLLEVDANGTAVDVGMAIAGMDQNAQFLRPDLGRSISKNKQHGVNDVGLAAAVWTNN